MNAAARALDYSLVSRRNVRLVFLSTRSVAMLGLMFALLASAFAVVYVKDLNRRVFNDIQTAEYEKSKLQEQWGKLLLQQSTLARQPRVSKIAADRWHMETPAASDAIILSIK